MSLSQLRTDLAEAVGTDQVTAHDHVPERISPPAAIVREAEPYITQGQTYGTWNVGHQVDLVAPRGTNQATTTALDQLLAQGVAALEDAGHTVTEVGAFYTLQANGTHYLAATITTTTEITEL